MAPLFIVAMGLIVARANALLKQPEPILALPTPASPTSNIALPVSHCFDQCSKQYFPEIMRASYRACRHGCRFAQYNNIVDNVGEPYHKCYSFCHSSYVDDLAEQEACIFSCGATFHSDATPLLPPQGQALLPSLIHNATGSSKCFGQLYGSIEGATCLAYIEMWQFNYRTFKCEQFIYGGCPEIPNMFDTKDACEKECGFLEKLHFGHHHAQSMAARGAEPPKCLAPIYAFYLKMGGLECENYEDKYQFNVDDGVCELFRYGGCIAVANMWDTKSACESECAMFTVPPTTTTTTTTEAPTTTIQRATQKSFWKDDFEHNFENKKQEDDLEANSASAEKKKTDCLPLILLSAFLAFH